MKSRPWFQELASLPYVTLTEQTRGNRDNYYDQWRTEKICLRQERFAASYDWVMVADIDEYLWFSENMGVKEFLQSHSDLTYLSFGKQMYTLDHRVDRAALDHNINTLEDGSFAVSHYPFYMNHFCYETPRNQTGFSNRVVARKKGDAICPTWHGRAKVIVRPSVHAKVKVHGTINRPNPANGTIHFHPDQAHFMEWPEIFAKHNVTLRYPQDFHIQTQDQVHIHDIRSAFKPIAGTNNYLVQYDDRLKKWFDFVISRANTKI